ncbi:MULTISPECIES: FmdB family zinc ribbon protein [Bacillus]|uniref:FmdB family zinc ribbon protein n=1 Tax=Bacillus TaxID=1386 RepID=UPI0002F7C238|nr:MULTISPECIES: zinc ribbon domain-containing protein [Bacillus]
MPSYTFKCSDCGEFTLFLKSMADYKEKMQCPDCLQEASRIYQPPNLFSYSKEVRNRVEKGMEPRRMTKEELGPKHRKRKPQISRPWQVGQ